MEAKKSSEGVHRCESDRAGMHSGVEEPGMKFDGLSDRTKECNVSSQEENHVENNNNNGKEGGVPTGELLVAIEKLSLQIDVMGKTNAAILGAVMKLVTNQDGSDTYPNDPVLQSGRHSPTEQHNCDPEMDNSKEANSNKTIDRTSKPPSDKDINKCTVFIDDSEDDTATERRSGGFKGIFSRATPATSTPSPEAAKNTKSQQHEATEDEIKQVKPFMSNYHRGLRSKKNEFVDSDVPKPIAATKKLQFSDTEKPNPKKNQNTGSDTTVNNANKTPKKSPVATPRGSKGKDPMTSAFRQSGHLIPKNAKCRFKVTADMRLSEYEATLCAYVFSTEKWQDEALFIVGNNFGTRVDFQCLCPGRLIYREIILYMALKVTWTQLNKPTKTVWCFPPNFAADVLRGSTIEELKMFYGNDWMHPFAELNLIYIPIEENGHWYLTVISFDQKKIFHLDSHLPNDKVQKRRYTIRDICITLAALLPQVFTGNDTLKADIGSKIQSWDIVEPRGIPNCGNSDRSGLWVLEWLRMEHLFSDNIPGVMNDNRVRINITMHLLLGSHNEQRHVLLAKSSDHWKELHTTDSV